MPRVVLAALFCALLAPAAVALDLVEYYHAGRDQYFLTGDANEMRDLDTGVHPGWTRTGEVLPIFDTGNPMLAGSTPVCRFAGNPARGLGSHFYSASPKECEDVRTRFGDDWLLESNEVFRVHPVSTAGVCPANTKPVHRLYNQRVDVNHRYTTQASIAQAMIARGYVAEGWGGPVPVVFCAADPAPEPPPACNVSASAATLQVGMPLTLSASCSGTIARYEWLACAPLSPDACTPVAECASATRVCTPIGRQAGRVLYAVRATNASGVSTKAGVIVTWDPAPTSAPSCTLTANPASPYAGGSTLLTATCSQAPTSYQWTGCAGSTGSTCRVSRATTGTATYSVTASNAIGTSVPASVTLTWQQPPPVGADLCSQFAKVKRIDLVWGGFAQTNDPGGGLEADAVLAARLVVPATAIGTNQAGLISIVEFVNPPTDRVITLSPSACDFRGFQPSSVLPTDPTGQSLPLAWGIGQSPSAMFALAGMQSGLPKLIPGQTYYVNLVNRSYLSGDPTCNIEECNVRVTVNPPR
jgi:hypothetical protein